MMTEHEQKQRILVVDDIGQNISVLNEILKPSYSVTAALTGEKAIELANSEKPLNAALSTSDHPFFVLTSFKEQRGLNR